MSPLGHQPLSPLDGRYRLATEALGEYFSEAALNRARVTVEIEGSDKPACVVDTISRYFP